MSEKVDDEPFDDTALWDEDHYVRGQPYMFMTPGGFTMIGWYVKPLGLGTHRFRNVRHMRNAGQQELPEICRKGITAATFTRASFRVWDCCPIGSSLYEGPIPADWRGGQS